MKQLGAGSSIGRCNDEMAGHLIYKNLHVTSNEPFLSGVGPAKGAPTHLFPMTQQLHSFPYGLMVPFFEGPPFFGGAAGAPPRGPL